jgi:histone deacetylase 6
MYRTGYIYDILMMLHAPAGYVPTDAAEDSGDGHPEDPMRIKRIFTRLKEAGLIGRMKKLQFEEVSPDQVMLVHSEDQWQEVQGTECGYGACAG